jgi:hypothetical protein
MSEKIPEITSLNAEDLDASELDEQMLEDVAGGDCGTYTVTCGTYTAAEQAGDNN